MTAAFMTACNDSETQESVHTPTPIPFHPMEASIADVHASIQSKGAQCTEIVQSYLNRIEAYDKKGPTLNSIIHINPTALQDAQALDKYFQETGKLKGDLHCVTVLPKDTIDVLGMPTTAGSNALNDNLPVDDAFIIQRIKNNGGIILGKANLDEFAFGFGGRSSHTQGGLTKNVYDLTKGSGGSSSGTSAAVSASLAMVGIGTDTGGSIRVPSSLQGLVGLRPSLRLISQDGIIPLAPTQDTAGPMCRKTIDCAILMNSLVGYDRSVHSNQRQGFDRLTPLVNSAEEYQQRFFVPKNYVPQTPSLVGKRVGIVRDLFVQPNAAGTYTEDGILINNAMEQAIQALQNAGAIVEDVTVNDLALILRTYSSLSTYEFKTSLTEYLKTTNSIFRSYTDLLNSKLMISAFSNYDRDTTSASFITGYRLNTITRGPHVRDSLNTALDNDGLSYDVLAYPTIHSLAVESGRSFTSGNNNRLSPFSGFPALSLPAASVISSKSNYPMNVNIEFMAREFDEPTLLNIAAAFEKAHPVRQIPAHTPELE